jgi:hypothetical protein
MLTRRELFHRLALGLTGALVALNVPSRYVRKVINPSTLQESVSKTLTKAYNDLVRGTGSNHHARWLVVGKDLMDAFEGELMVLTRYVDLDMEDQGYRSLKFKSVTMVSDGPGWHYEFRKDPPSWLRR